MTQEQKDEVKSHPFVKAVRASIRNWVLGSGVCFAAVSIWISRGLFDEIKESSAANVRQDISIQVLSDSNKEHGKRLWAGHLHNDTLFIAELPAKHKYVSRFGPSVTDE